MGLMFPIYFISMIMSAGLALLSASQILDLSDLDCDYINPQQCCIRLNKLVMPEIILVGLLVLVHLMTMNWIPFVLFLPLLAYLIYSHRSTPRGYVSIFDATTIKEQQVINLHVRKNLFKAIFYVVHFVLFLYFALLEIAIV